jgi:hypothetical protein
VHHAVVHDLLDLVEHGLALLPIQLPGLALVEIFDAVRKAARSIVRRHVRMPTAWR